MARYENDKIVKPSPKDGDGSFAAVKKAAAQQSPVSTKYEDARKYVKGGK